MHKSDQVDTLVRLILREGASGVAAPNAPSNAMLDTTVNPVFDADSTAAMRARFIAAFDGQVRGPLLELRMLLHKGDVGAMPGTLHTLLGTAQAAGARRLEHAVRACKMSFGPTDLMLLEQLHAATLAAMREAAPDAGSGAAGSSADGETPFFAQLADRVPDADA